MVEILERLPHMNVVYETDLCAQERWPATSDRVFEHLGLAPVSVHTKNVRRVATSAPLRRHVPRLR